MDERIYGLLGRKLGHSWSVPIHAALGNGAYRLLELEPDGLAPFLHRKDIGGLNVTIPYKRDVMPLCDEIDPAAEAIGSVNTIVRCADGKLVGYNTDIDGFLYMACRAGISLSGKKVVILGSGGASLTAQTAARQGGAAEVVVVSRFGPDNYDNLSRHADAEILVNATPVGMYPGNGQSPVDLSVFPVCQGVLDVIYNPRRTALLLQAEARSIPCSDGLPMLVAQAVAAAIDEIYDRTGQDSILVTHSQGGLPGWEVPRYTDHVAAIVAIEPGGAPQVDSDAYNAMVEQEIPVTFYYGDYIGEAFTDVPAAAMWSMMASSADTFTEAYNAAGGNSTVIHLPDEGITGNSHFMFQELNNDIIADHIETWIQENVEQ